MRTILTRLARKVRTHALAACTGVALCLAPGPARAQMEVIDPSNLAQNIEQAAHAVELIRNQLREIEALTSHAGYGALADGPEAHALRRYAPQGWEETLAILEAGGLPGDADAVAAAIAALRQSYAPLSAEELAGAPVSEATRAAHARAQAAGLLAEGVASTAYAQIETRIGHVEEMIGAIDAAPDIKAAQDLQARISGETALAQIELVRLEALSAALAAQDANRRNAAQARMQRFLNPPASDADIAARP